MAEKIKLPPGAKLVDENTPLPPGARLVSANGGAPSHGVVSQSVLDNLREKSAQPTQFENDRPANPSEGFWGGLGSTIGNTIKGMVLPTGVQPGGYPSMQYAGPGKGFTDDPALDPKQIEAHEAQVSDQNRVASGRTKAYRVAAAVASPVADVEGMERSADAGDTGGVIGHAVGSAAPLIAGEAVRRTAKPIGEFLKAPSDPNTVYNSYLHPVSKMPITVPDAPHPVMQAVLRDMEAAGEGEAANRIQSGSATVGDLDSMRQRANRLSRSIYRSPGNYPPGMAEGANNFAGSIRDLIYPLIEESQGLPEGSLKDVKRLQGKMMESERNPSLTNRIIVKGAGGGAGSILGYSAGGWPGGVVGGMVGQAVAEPIATGIDRALIGAQTKAVASKLPSPGLTPRMALPVPRTMPAAPEARAPMANAPAWSQTSRAQRLGLLLPEETGGPIELPYVPEMSEGENVAATMQQLRRPVPIGLPEKGVPIRLQPSSLPRR